MKKFQNICSTIIIAVCAISLMEVGYPIFPIIIILLQILVIIVNNRLFYKGNNIDNLNKDFDNVFTQKSVEDKIAIDQSVDCSQFDAHEQLLIEKVIEMLKTKPECFSARWYNGKTLDKSVRSQNKEILIIISSGQISHPLEPKMSEDQKRLVKQLLEPIVKKDSDYLIERLDCNCS